MELLHLQDNKATQFNRTTPPKSWEFALEHRFPPVRHCQEEPKQGGDTDKPISGTAGEDWEGAARQRAVSITPGRGAPCFKPCTGSTAGTRWEVKQPRSCCLAGKAAARPTPRQAKKVGSDSGQQKSLQKTRWYLVSLEARPPLHRENVLLCRFKCSAGRAPPPGRRVPCDFTNQTGRPSPRPQRRRSSWSQHVCVLHAEAAPATAGLGGLGGHG